MWQDPAIAIAVFVITLTTIPMIQQRVTPPLSTSVPLIGGALVLVVAYATLGLWLSFAVEVIAILLWAVLLARGIRARLVHMRLPFWLCNLLGHDYKWVVLVQRMNQPDTGRKECTRCPATLRVKGSDWRTW